MPYPLEDGCLTTKCCTHFYCEDGLMGRRDATWVDSMAHGGCTLCAAAAFWMVLHHLGLGAVTVDGDSVILAVGNIYGVCMLVYAGL